MNAHLERILAVRMVCVQTQLDRSLVDVNQATLETDLIAQVSHYEEFKNITKIFHKRCFELNLH